MVDVATGDRESLERIAAAVNKGGEGPRPLPLSTGVVLLIKRVPVMLPTDIAAEALRVQPKVPRVFVEALDRVEENPDDPDYKWGLQQWQAGMLLDMNTAFILLGTEPTTIPEGVPAADAAEFLEQIKILRRDVEGPRARYLAWGKYCAAPDQNDIASIVREVGRLSGVSEADVSEAVQGFQR